MINHQGNKSVKKVTHAFKLSCLGDFSEGLLIELRLWTSASTGNFELLFTSLSNWNIIFDASKKIEVMFDSILEKLELKKWHQIWFLLLYTSQGFQICSVNLLLISSSRLNLRPSWRTTKRMLKNCIMTVHLSLWNNFHFFIKLLFIVSIYSLLSY